MKFIKRSIHLPDGAFRSLVGESWALAWPMVFIMLYEFLVGLTDIYVAGRFGSDVQAAYGVAFQLYFIFILIGIALSTGVVAVVSRLFASGSQALPRAIGTSVILALVAGIFFSVIGIFGAGAIVKLLGICPEIADATTTLVRVYSVGFVFDYILLTVNSILRACGRIRESLIIMTIVCLANIGLNLTLALRTPLGAAGIAWSTVASLGIGAILCIISLRGILRAHLRLDTEYIREIAVISWPSGVLQVSWQLAAMALFLIIGALPQSAIDTMAAFTNGIKIESAIFLPVFAFNMANAVVVGKLLGAGDRERAFHGGIVTAVLGVAITVVLTGLVMLNARWVASFVSMDQQVIEASIRYMYIAFLSEPFMAWGMILAGGLNGAGDTRGVMVVSVMTVWLVRIPLAYLFGITTGWGAIAIWWAMNISVVAMCYFMTRRYYSKRWMNA